MNELSGQAKKQLTRKGVSPEVAGLNQLLNMMNNPAITGAEVPKGESVNVPMPHPNLQRLPVQPPAPNAGETTAFAAATSPAIVPGRRASVNRLFFTGTIASGKDYVAEACGAQVVGFADPIYALVNKLFGTAVSATSGKDIPGVRSLMQILGQWGRGDVNEKYPLTPARGLMLLYVRSLAGSMPEELCVDWASYGLHKDIWLDSLIERASRLDPSRRVAATNVRFENEFKRLASEGWQHYHVFCSGAMRNERLKKQGIDPAKAGATLSDDSEKLAQFLDSDVSRKSKMPGNKLRCIWNDTAPSPSKRLYTVNEFLQELAIGEAASDLAPAASME